MKCSSAFIAIPLAVAFCWSNAFAQTKSVTLGAAIQLTGATANTGRYYQDAYNITIDMINEKGGIHVGGENYKLSLDILDNQSDVNLGVRQYVQLITRDKVNFLLGPFSSNDALDDSSVAEKYQIPMVQGGGAASSIYSRGYAYIFGTLPPADNYFASTIDMLGKLNPKVQTVALVSADDSFDVSVAKGTRSLIAKALMKIVVDEKYHENAADFSSVLTQIKSAQADAVFLASHETEALNFIRQAKSLDVNPRYFYAFTVGVPTADFRKALGKDADYAFGMTAWLPSAAQKDRWFGDGAKFAAEYKAKFGYEPDYHAASGVADVEALVMAMEKADSVDPKKVRDALAAIKFDSVYGPIAFDAHGQINLPQTVIQVQNDALVPIFAEKDFINQPKYPMPAWNAR